MEKDVFTFIIFGAGWLILAIWLLLITISIRKINNRQRAIAKATESGDFIDAVERSLREIPVLTQGLEEVRSDNARLETALALTVKRVGLVRFDAFNDVGGKLSFSMALLNDHGDGIVLSTIYGRQESRSYAKLVKKGVSEYTLSAEEYKAISEALSKGREKSLV